MSSINTGRKTSQPNTSSPLKGEARLDDPELQPTKPEQTFDTVKSVEKTSGDEEDHESIYFSDDGYDDKPGDSEQHKTPLELMKTYNVLAASAEWNWVDAAIGVLAELIGSLCALLFPALICYFIYAKEVGEYGLLERKPPTADLNPWSEFVRWSVFVATAYGAWVMALFAGKFIPHILMGWAKHKSARRHLAYLQSISLYTGTAAWLLFVNWLGGFLLYDASKLTGILANPPKTTTPAGTTLTPTMLLNAANWHGWVERFLAAGAVFAFFFALEKWLIAFVRVSFQRKAFLDRVNVCRHRLDVLHALHKWAKAGGGFKTKQSDSKLSNKKDFVLTLRALQRESRDLSLLAEMEHDRLMPLGVCRTKGQWVADEIFTQGFRNEPLTVDSFRQAFPDSSDKPESVAGCKEAFAVFASHDLLGDDSASASTPDAVGELSRADFTAAVIDIYEQRHNIQRSLRANSRIVSKLDTLLMGLFAGIAGAASSPLLKVDFSKEFAWLGVVLAATAFLLRNVAQTVFNAFLFVFVEHAYDVGDRVVIGGEHLLVREIEIFATTFVKADGTIVVMPNSMLSGRDIENLRRSSNQWEVQDVQVPSGMSAAALQLFIKELREALSHQPNLKREFTGALEVTALDINPASTCKMSLIVQVRGNFQEQSKRFARKAVFAQLARDILAKNLSKS